MALSDQKLPITSTEQVQKIDICDSKYRIFKNLTVVSSGMFLILAAGDLMQTYQSTLNRDKGVGVASVAVQYAFNCCSTLFLTKYLVTKFGSKRIYVLSITLFIPFFLANYYPLSSLMLLSSVLNGFGYSWLWVSVDLHINGLSSMYADKELETLRSNACKERTISKQKERCLKRELSIKQCSCLHSASTYCSCSNVDLYPKSVVELKESNCKTVYDGIMAEQNIAKHILQCSENQNKTILERSTVRFFSFHAMIYQSCNIFGNLASFFVLQRDYSLNLHPTSLNGSCLCGIEYCNVDSVCSEQNLQQPSAEGRNILVFGCVGFSLIAAVIVFFFPDDLVRKEDISFSLGMLGATFKQAKKKNSLLLAPLVVHIGLMKGFNLGDFTKSYVGCAWGLRYVGLVSTCSSACMVVCSTASGWFTKRLGRLPVFLTAFMFSTVYFGILIFWKPDESSPAMFFVGAGLYGGYFGIYFTQGRAFFGVLFKKDEAAAFAVFQLWFSVSSCICLSYSDYLCNDIKVYIMIAASVLGLIGYLVVERELYLMNKTSVLPPQNSEPNIVEVTRF